MSGILFEDLLGKKELDFKKEKKALILKLSLIIVTTNIFSFLLSSTIYERPAAKSKQMDIPANYLLLKLGGETIVPVEQEMNEPIKVSIYQDKKMIITEALLYQQIENEDQSKTFLTAINIKELNRLKPPYQNILITPKGENSVVYQNKKEEITHEITL